MTDKVKKSIIIWLKLVSFIIQQIHIKLEKTKQKSPKTNKKIDDIKEDSCSDEWQQEGTVILSCRGKGEELGGWEIKVLASHTEDLGFEWPQCHWDLFRSILAHSLFHECWAGRLDCEHFRELAQTNRQYYDDDGTNTCINNHYFRYYLRVDKRQIGLKWADKFVDLMRNTKLGDGVEIAYASSQSLEQVSLFLMKRNIFKYITSYSLCKEKSRSTNLSEISSFQCF